MRYLPTVTEVIGPWVDFSRIPADVLNHASERGTEVHRVCLDLYAKGLPVMGIDAEISGYFKSFREWFDRVFCHAFAIEERFFDDANGYSGQMDLVIGTDSGEVWLLDLKTPMSLSKSWRVQVSAYRNLSMCNGIEPDRCGSLRLDKDGGPAKVDWFEGSAERDFVVFLSALNCFRHFRG